MNINRQMMVKIRTTWVTKIEIVQIKDYLKEEVMGESHLKEENNAI